MIDVEANAPGFAVNWARQLGGSPLTLERLRGGINNRVYRCGSNNQKWVIKGYTPVKLGQRDRMQAEVEFLRFAYQAAPGFTPALIEVDLEQRCVVLEHIEGEAFPVGVPPSEAAVAEAVEFFRRLNAASQLELARESIQLGAAEGFLSLRQHLNNVHERLERMSCIHLESHLRPQAEALLRQLQRKLDYTEGWISRMIGQGMVADEIDRNLLCVSPSDFGFHNAIQTAKGIRFIDFEFSGWDDPAKAAQDFILQPRIPIAKELSPLTTALPLELRPTILRRCKAIGPILELKWACIQLAVLQPARLEEILSVAPELTYTLIQKRLEKACYYLKLSHEGAEA